jgi:hypothetical protein
MNYPVPSVLFDGKTWVVAINRSCQVPAKSKEEAIEYAHLRGVSTKWGKLYAQENETSKRFELIFEAEEEEEEEV